MKVVLENKVGKTIISIILGLGLASLFRRACKNNNCIVIKGPNPNLIKGKTFRYEDKCYKYNPKATNCNK
jgi:hypothetical protein